MYRKMILSNHGPSVNHMYESLEQMLADGPCDLHVGSATASACNGCTQSDKNPADPDVHIGVTGSPCNPYSTQRCKRFADDSVASHSMTTTTMDSVIAFYKKFEPKVGVTEQVKGFDMRESSSDPTTPCSKLPG